MPQSKADQIDMIVQVQLSHKIRAVVFNGTVTYRESQRYLAVAKTFYYKLKDSSFPVT